MIIIPCPNPSRLLHLIKKAIDERSVRTWSYDNDGDFTHTAEQWVGQAWLRPKVVENQLRFFIVPPQDTHISSSVYAIFHGRFVEMIVRHFDGEVSDNLQISPLPKLGDAVS